MTTETLYEILLEQYTGHYNIILILKNRNKLQKAKNSTFWLSL